jgi:outer membrane protein assembly factor BamE (lipoprotein component of BamABCDE complex)
MVTRMRTVVCFAIVALSLAACATVGRSFDTTHVNDVKAGQNKEQVKAWFGAPSSTTALNENPKGCVERWQWVHATATVGSAAKAQALVVDFDETGTVCDHGYSER